MKTNGFTLLELVVAISITGVLLALAAPSFVDMINSNRLNTVTNELISTFNFARSESVKRNSDVVVDLNRLVVMPSGCDNQNCWLKAIDSLPADYRITYYPTTSAITYHSGGTLEPSGYLKLCTPDNMKVIIFQFIGQLQIARDRDENGLPEVFNSATGNFEDVEPCAIVVD